MKKAFVFLLTLILLALSVSAFAGVPARLNQKMATRSGPGTRYSEELGTIPMSTSIEVINCVTTNGTPWCLVEFTRNGKLYRCYTGLKRIDTSYDLPEGSTSAVKDTVTQDTKVYYGPGKKYAVRTGTLGKGTEVRVYEVEGDWAMVDYVRKKVQQRGYIPVDCLKKTVAEVTLKIVI